jgi:hypothetical protein
MAKLRTDLLVSYQSKGYSEVQNQMGKLAGSAAKANEQQARGYSEVNTEVERLRKRLQDLSVEQLELNKQMEAVDRASPAYKKLQEQLKGVQREGQGVERMLRQVERAFKDQTDSADKAATKHLKAMEEMQRRGSLMQGLIQGMVPEAAGLQRGPGMMRQAIGMGAGRAVRGMGAGMMGVPFSGAQAIATTLREIPFAGGLLAAPFEQASQFGGQALQVQRQRMQMLPSMNIAGFGARTRRTEQAALRRERGGIEERVGQFRAGLIQRTPMEPLPEGTPMFSFEQGRGFAPTEEAQRLPPGIEEATRGERRRQEEAVRRRVRRRARRDLFGGIRGAGRELLGVGEPEALQRAQAMVGAAGGTMQGLRRQGMLRTGMAAEALFGVQAPTAGAFARGGRLGAFAGAQPGERGMGARAMTEAIAGAMEMGLSGAEIPNYLQQIAGGITQWEQTGIPVAREALVGFGTEISKLGLGGVRGGAVGAGFVRAAQGLSRRGPQSAGELMMLQTLGGFQGGGAGAFEQAQIQMEQLDPTKIGSEQIQNLIGRYMQAGGGGAAGRILARQQLGQMGIQVGAEEMQLLGRRISGEKLSKAQEQRMRMLSEQRQEAAVGAPRTPKQMQDQAIKMLDMFGGALQKQASIQNDQIKAGEKMIPMLHALEGTSTALAKKFGELAGDPLGDFAGSLERAAKKLIAFEEGITWLSDWF